MAGDRLSQLDLFGSDGSVSAAAASVGVRVVAAVPVEAVVSVVAPVALAAAAAVGRKVVASAGIADAGAELVRNRRNILKSAKGWGDVAHLNDALKAREVVKANVWPKPDYKALIAGGMQPIVAHIVKQVYDSVAIKPVVGGRSVVDDAVFQRYITGVNRVETGLMQWVEDSNALRAWTAANMRVAGAMLGRQVSLSDLASDPRSLLDLVFPGGVKLFRDEALVVGGNKVIGALVPRYEEVNRAVSAIKKGWPEKREAWEVQGFSVVENPVVRAEVSGGRLNSFFLAVNERYVKSFDSMAEAEIAKAGIKPFALFGKRGFLSSFDSELEAVEAAKEHARRDKSQVVGEKGVRVESVEREGVSRRMEGEDVSAERLVADFGLKGVNFGNWMKTPAARAEAQLHLNHAFDSFHDLAEIMGVPPQAISLNGLLGLAIGAQGSGGSVAAHFVPGVNEINLTRTMGAGSVAHEWAHALDHYFAVQGGLATSDAPYLTEHAKLGSVRSVVQQVAGGGYGSVNVPRFGSLRSEVVDSFSVIVDSMSKRVLSEVEMEAAQAAKMTKAKGSLAGWLKSVRRDFDGQEDAFDVLAKRVSDGDVGDGHVALSRSVYISPVLAEMRDLFKAKNGRVYSIDKLKSVQSWINHIEHLEARSRTDDGWRAPTQVATNYEKAALELDKEKGGKPYWSSGRELFARAFDSFVSDSLAAKMARNDYLSHTGRADVTVPLDAERGAVNAAFQGLVGTIKTKAVGQGVPMFSRAAPLDLTAKDTPVSIGWKLISSNDDAFQLPLSHGKTLEAVAADFDPKIEVVKGKGGHNYQEWLVTSHGDNASSTASVKQFEDKSVVLDISEFFPGDAGRTIYQIVGDFAHNSGQVFVGDPNGLSEIAQLRRTENMISSALRWGTTDHLAPHEYQLKPLAQGVKGFEWKAGDTEFNLGQMLLVSSANTRNFIPELSQVEYNFSQQCFEAKDENGTTREYLDSDFETLAKSRGSREAQAGRTTLKRAAFTHAVLQESRGTGWPGVLGALVRQSSEQLDDPLRRVLYSRELAVDGLPMFSAAVGQAPVSMPLAEISDEIKRLRGQWPSMPSVTVVARVLDLPFSAPANADGVYCDGKVYVVAENVANLKQLQKVMAHECVLHHSLEDMLGAYGFSKLHHGVQMLKAKGDPVVTALAANILSRYGELPPEIETKEIVARAGEQCLDDSGNVKVAFGFMKSVFAGVAGWLRDHGLSVPFTNTELQGIMHDAGDWIKQEPDRGSRSHQLNSVVSAGLVLNSFAGVRAETAPLDALRVAREMVLSGDDDRVIWEKTGWTFGFADGKPRFEISDDQARAVIVGRSMGEVWKDMESVDGTMNNIGQFMRKYPDSDLTAEINNHKGVKASYSEIATDDPLAARAIEEFLEHKRLFDAYPELAKIKAGQSTGISGLVNAGAAAFVPDANLIKYSRINNPDQFVSTTLHELQHAIQEIEGFALGGSPNEFKALDLTNKKLDEINSKVQGLLDSSPDLRSSVVLSNVLQDAIVEKYGDLMEADDDDPLVKDWQVAVDLRNDHPLFNEFFSLKNIERQVARANIVMSPVEQYSRLAGEVEGRLTQARIDMSPAERVAQYPLDDMDVPVSGQAVRLPSKDAKGVTEGMFSGKVLDVADGVVTQRVTREGGVVRHSIASLSTPVVIGQVVDIKYAGGVGVVSGRGIGVER